MSQSAQRKNASPSSSAEAGARKKRRLTDGPAVRRALELTAAEAKDSGGWKLLEVPPSSEKLTEQPALDSTQPEANWKVVAVQDEALTSPLPSGAAAHEGVKAPATGRRRVPSNALCASGTKHPTGTKRRIAGKAGAVLPGQREAGSRAPRGQRASPTTKLSQGVEAQRVDSPPEEGALQKRRVDAFAEASRTRPAAASKVSGRAGSQALLGGAKGASHPNRVAPAFDVLVRPRPAAGVPRPDDAPPAPRHFRTPVGRPATVVRAGPMAHNASEMAPSAAPRTQMGVAPPDAELPKTFMGVAPPPGALDLPRTHMGVAPPAPPLRPPPPRRPPPPKAPAAEQSPAGTVSDPRPERPADPEDPEQAQVQSSVPDLALPSVPARVPAQSYETSVDPADRAPVTQAWTMAETQLGPPVPPALETRGSSPAAEEAPRAAAENLGAGARVSAPELAAGAGRSPLPSPAPGSELTTSAFSTDAVLDGGRRKLGNPPRSRLAVVIAWGVLAACVPLCILGVARFVLPEDAPSPGAQPVAQPAPAIPAAASQESKPDEPSKSASAPPQPTPKPVNQPAAQAASATLEQVGRAQLVPAAAGVADIPWRDRVSVDTGSCESLVVERPAGPIGYLLGKATKKAQAELIRGDTKGAHVAFCEALLLSEPTTTLLMGLSRVLLMQSDLERALVSVERVLEQDPDSTQALELKGDILIRSGRVDEAKHAWIKAAGASRASQLLVQNLVKASRNGAAGALKAGDLPRAERMLRRAIAFDPADKDTCLKLARVLEQSAASEAARRWTAYAASLDV